jgi:uncharacterized protein YicC (UPF0701 family)
MIAAIYARKSTDQGRRSDHRTTRENMMGKRTSSAKKLNKEPKGNGASVDQQILATLKEILSSLQSIQSEMPSGLPIDMLAMMEQRLNDILRELRHHRPQRETS